LPSRLATAQPPPLNLPCTVSEQIGIHHANEVSRKEALSHASISNTDLVQLICDL
jgi:hypothetical protein